MREQLMAAAALGLVLAAANGANAAEKTYVFALVPKSTNNPFYDQALAGCVQKNAATCIGGGT